MCPFSSSPLYPCLFPSAFWSTDINYFTVSLSVRPSVLDFVQCDWLHSVVHEFTTRNLHRSSSSCPRIPIRIHRLAFKIRPRREKQGELDWEPEKLMRYFPRSNTQQLATWSASSSRATFACFCIIKRLSPGRLALPGHWRCRAVRRATVSIYYWYPTLYRIDTHMK